VEHALAIQATREICAMSAPTASMKTRVMMAELFANVSKASVIVFFN